MEQLVDIVGHRPDGSTPVVICIAGTTEERTRLAAMFDGAGVLVMAPDADSARTFLGTLREGEPSAASRVVRVGGLRLDPAHHEATWHGQPLQLTAHELKVLACLASSPGRAWTYRQLHERAWEEPYFTGPAALQSVIKRLRAKLRQLDPPLHIHAVRGLGFRLAMSSELHVVY
jgi:DNA-binding response OmpR family regulator